MNKYDETTVMEESPFLSQVSVPTSDEDLLISSSSSDEDNKSDGEQIGLAGLLSIGPPLESPALLSSVQTAATTSRHSNNDPPKQDEPLKEVSPPVVITEEEEEEEQSEPANKKPLGSRTSASDDSFLGSSTFSSLQVKASSPFSFSSSTPSRSVSFNSPTTTGISAPTSWAVYQHRHKQLPNTLHSRLRHDRRERSQSTVANPYLTHPYRNLNHLIERPPSSSYYDHGLSKSKRRSISAGGPSLSVSPPSKALRPDPSGSALSDEEQYQFQEVESPYQYVSPPTGWDKPSTYGSRLVSREAPSRLSNSRSHVRFSADLDTRSDHGDYEPLGYKSPTPTSGSSEPSYRCHHLIAEEVQSKYKEDSGNTVQRTHSNPEMEYCPVCLARKECEILLKRTYSKVLARFTFY